MWCVCLCAFICVWFKVKQFHIILFRNFSYIIEKIDILYKNVIWNCSRWSSLFKRQGHTYKWIPTRCHFTVLYFLYVRFSTCFGHTFAHHQEITTRYLTRCCMCSQICNLLMMGESVPETCWESDIQEIKYCKVASCWYPFITWSRMHGTQNIRVILYLAQ
jgi:hypothetical protein